MEAILGMTYTTIALLALTGFVVAMAIHIALLRYSVKDAHAKIAREIDVRRCEQERLDGGLWGAKRDFWALCEHLGATIEKEPSRLVVRIKGGPEPG